MPLFSLTVLYDFILIVHRRVPVVNIDKLIKEELGSRRRRAPQEDDWDFSEFETETLVENEDMSVTKYPAPYCDQVQDPCMW